MLVVCEATGLNLYEVQRLPVLVENHIFRRGSVQEGRHRETRLLLASATAIHAEKLKVDDLLKDTARVRFPERLSEERRMYDHNRERALEAIRARQKGMQ